MKKIIVLLSLTVISLSSIAQISVTSGQPVANYVLNNLLGQGVTVSNITLTGNAAQIGSFNGASWGSGFLGGVVMSTGDVTHLVPGQTGTDIFSSTSNADLVAVAQSVTTNPDASLITDANDVAILEFDFIPESNLVSFDFIFGSNEYEDWINSEYNDAFGFFVSGPGISGPYSAPAGFPNGSANLALVPGTNLPITISTIYPAGAASFNPSNPAGLNAQYYIENNAQNDVSLNGYTVPINIQFDVQCGETYHFKFAIADIADQSYSTAIFLQEGSFTSPPLNLSLDTGPAGNNHVVENCNDVTVYFTRPSCQNLNDITFNYTLSGSATYGTDYTVNTASPLTIPAGQDTVFLTISTIGDGLVEGSETVTIDIDYVDNYGNPQTATGTFFIDDIVPLSIDDHDTLVKCTGVPTTITAIGHGGSGVYTYDWALSSSDSTQDVVLINQNGTYNYPITITDACLGSYSDTVTVVMQQTLAIDSLVPVIASACANDGVVVAYVSGLTINTGQPLYKWNGPGATNPAFINSTVWQNRPSGWYYFMVTDNVCSMRDSVFVDQEPPPVAQFAPSITSGCDPLNVTFTNNSQNSTNYEWYFGNGQTAFVNDLASQNQTYNSDATIMLIAIAGPCRDTAYANVSVVVCGCTDPVSLNYNPAAVFDDGSCVYPMPMVVAPNIFTPNGDNENDFFELDVDNAVSIELIVVNRWGELMYQGTGINPNPRWDGKDAPEGVYFYSYTIKGQVGQEVSGQGFVELIRNK